MKEIMNDRAKDKKTEKISDNSVINMVNNNFIGNANNNDSPSSSISPRSIVQSISGLTKIAKRRMKSKSFSGRPASDLILEDGNSTSYIKILQNNNNNLQHKVPEDLHIRQNQGDVRLLEDPNDYHKNKFQEQHNAYRKTNTKCSKKGCGGTIVRIVVAGRGTHYCDKHQKLN